MDIGPRPGKLDRCVPLGIRKPERLNYAACFPPRVLRLDIINSMVTRAICWARVHPNPPDCAPQPWTQLTTAHNNNLPSSLSSSLLPMSLFSPPPLLSIFCCLPLPSFIPPPALLAFFIRLVSVLCNQELQLILEGKNVNTPIPHKSHIDITEKARWISLTLELWKLMQEDCEFETSLSYIESLLLNEHKQTNTQNY